MADAAPYQSAAKWSCLEDGTGMTSIIISYSQAAGAPTNSCKTISEKLLRGILSTFPLPFLFIPEVPHLPLINNDKTQWITCPGGEGSAGTLPASESRAEGAPTHTPPTQRHL